MGTQLVLQSFYINLQQCANDSVIILSITFLIQFTNKNYYHNMVKYNVYSKLLIRNTHFVLAVIRY